MAETFPGLALIEIRWVGAPEGKAQILAEPVRGHLAIHPEIDEIEDDDTGAVIGHRFGDAWKVSHIPSGMSACPYESLPTVHAAREWARIFADLPGVDLSATDKPAVTAGVDKQVLWDAWRECADRTWKQHLQEATR